MASAQDRLIKGHYLRLCDFVWLIVCFTENQLVFIHQDLKSKRLQQVVGKMGENPTLRYVCMQELHATCHGDGGEKHAIPSTSPTPP
eukprot:scaffold386798_cov39-Prasinocladus_malaysianus.AAC.1